MSDAIHVARRHWGAYREQNCVDGISAIFVAVLGTETEKERVLARLEAERDMAERPVWEFRSPPGALPTVLQIVEQSEGWRH